MTTFPMHLANFDVGIKISLLFEYNQYTYEKKRMHRFCENIVSLLRISNFSILVAKSYKNVLIFGDFDHQSFIYEQNRCHIWNQRQKLSRMTYVLAKNIFHQKCICTPPGAHF